MVGTSANNADSDSVSLVPAGISVDNVDAASRIQVVNGSLTVDFPNLEETARVSQIVVCNGDTRDDAGGSFARLLSARGA